MTERTIMGYLLSWHWLVLPIVELLLIAAWVWLRWRRRSIRGREWLQASTLLGGICIGLVVATAAQLPSADSFTLIPAAWRWLEVLAVGGALWGLLATLVRNWFEPVLTNPIKVDWFSFGATLAALWIAAIAGQHLGSSQLLVAAVLILAGTTLSAWHLPRLWASLVAGLLTLLIVAIGSSIGGSLWQILPRVWHIGGPVYATVGWPTLVLAFALGFAMPGLTTWWLRQPLQPAYH